MEGSDITNCTEYWEGAELDFIFGCDNLSFASYNTSHHSVFSSSSPCQLCNSERGGSGEVLPEHQWSLARKLWAVLRMPQSSSSPAQLTSCPNAVRWHFCLAFCPRSEHQEDKSFGQSSSSSDIACTCCFYSICCFWEARKRWRMAALQPTIRLQL